MTDSDFRGKRILVTGASSGIGRETAILLAGQGAHVAVHYGTRGEAAADVVSVIERSGGRAYALGADFRTSSERATLVRRAIEALGGLDGLVSNAGQIPGPAMALDIAEDLWREAFEVNVHAPFFIARDAFTHMQRHGGGRIVNVSSIGVKFGGSPATLHYSAAKRAMEGVTLGLAKLGAEHGILVNTVRAGVIETAMHAARGAEAMERRRQLIPMKRFGLAVEVARMIVFLLGPGGDFITGQELAVSGGE